MNFKENKEIHDRLLGTTHIEADLALLRARSPQHKLLSATRFNLVVFASDLLMALLNETAEEQIVRNRREFVAEAAAEAEALAEKEAAEKAAAEKEAAEAAAEAEALAEKEAAEKTTGEIKKKGSQRSKNTPK